MVNALVSQDVWLCSEATEEITCLLDQWLLEIMDEMANWLVQLVDVGW